MKKLLTIAVAAALMFAAAGQASAAALETSGQYRARYWYLDSYTMGGDGHQDFFDQRLRLNMGWNVAEGLKLVARADVMENNWDFSGNDTQAAANSKAEIDFDQAYAQYTMGAHMLAAGKMDVSWGTGLYAAADNRYRFKMGTKFGETSVGFAIDMVQEVYDSPVQGDNMAYTLNAVFPLAGGQLGLLGLLGDNWTSPGNETLVYGFIPYFKGAFGTVKFNAEFAYAWGTKENEAAETEQDLETILAYAGAFVPAGPVSLGFEFAYAQGHIGDDKQGVVAGADYNSSFNSFILFNQFDLSGWNSNYGTDIGVNNAIAGKLSGAFALNKQFSLIGAIVAAEADTAVEGQDKTMGIEFDLLAKYVISDNLTFQAGGGYLAAGDYYGEVDDPWVLTTHMVVTF